MRLVKLTLASCEDGCVCSEPNIFGLVDILRNDVNVIATAHSPRNATLTGNDQKSI